ncbi:MAG TPA: alpha/beta hydrolase-fold protein, partial [Thermoanaerobaculia bacterium]
MFASLLCAALLAASAPKPSPTVLRPSPTAVPAAPSSAGKVVQHRVASTVLGGERRVWVYTPPGYERGGAAEYDLLIVFDGEEYLTEFQLPAMLDSLLAERKAGPFVAVLIDNGSGAVRLGDLANRFQFAEFLSGDLIEWVRGRWKVTRDPRRTILAGSSAGSLAAAYAAFRRPDLFGNVLSQSGAFWRGDE